MRVVLIALVCWVAPAVVAQPGYFFPEPGESLAQQNRQPPEAVGMAADLSPLIDRVNAMMEPHKDGRWALWRHGYLVHVEKPELFATNSQVANLRELLFGVSVGGALQQGRIDAVDSSAAAYLADDLPVTHRDMTWAMMLNHTTGLNHRAWGEPGRKFYWDERAGQEALVYALANLYELEAHDVGALIERFEAVTQATFAEAIGMTGYGFENKKGLLRYRLDLEDMGRVGLLLVARGRWGQTQVLPAWFVRAMETPQVGEDVEVHYHPHKHHARAAFPEAPYGYRCWVNARRDVFPDADAGWCWGNREGHFLLWNHELGIVFATDGIEGAYTSWREGPHERSIAWQIEQQIVGDNPLFAPAVESASD